LTWPSGIGLPKIDSLDGERIRSYLKTRRNDLTNYAREYYALLSKEVFIPATTDKDLIKVDALGDGELAVSILRTEKDSNYVFYHRTFNDDVTKELRIFGLNKQDSLKLSGDGAASTKIRFIGGSGKDKLLNTSSHPDYKSI
jgi:hypothetical protein